jgi:hypothetical protein
VGRATQWAEACSVLGLLQTPLEMAIAGMSQGEGVFDASELNGPHETRALSRAMSGEPLLELPLCAIPDVVPSVKVRLVK